MNDFIKQSSFINIQQPIQVILWFLSSVQPELKPYIHLLLNDFLKQSSFIDNQLPMVCQKIGARYTEVTPQMQNQ